MLVVREILLAQISHALIALAVGNPRIQIAHDASEPPEFCARAGIKDFATGGTVARPRWHLLLASRAPDA
jgi:hypothetical protein